MSEKDKYPSEMAERFQLRLPPGLRDRIKAYAESHGRSMNTEIVRVLEREYPEQWPVGERLTYLAEMLSILKSGASDDRIDQFVSEFEDTLEGIITGRITDVDIEARSQVQSLWDEYQEREAERVTHAAYEGYDQDEIESLERNGTTEKFAEPRPKKPNPMGDSFHLMDIIPRGPLSEMAEKLSKGDTEGAAEIVRNIPKSEIEKRIRFHALSMFEQDRLRRESDGDVPEEHYDPFKFPE
ncbi:Arc family DNA-binding protein [Rhizobiaceae bacterium n13]|uniref:Arc family DNA-binding protein n=1 Tax=Ferirhizobium litorale TaxID=2927786 RepID=UPI0024B2D3F2|nr:Arc family DNA-binding protein [Fererhizobium litorale]MDI7865065.1 Arc family DNA-binding protein [Fererhizobium litorale]